MWLACVLFVATVGGSPLAAKAKTAAPGTPKAPAVAAAPAAPSTSYPSAEALGRYAQARLLQERGADGDAMAEYYRVLVLDPQAASAARNLSSIQAERGEAGPSLESAERVLGIDPDDAQALWLKGGAEFNLGRARQAYATLLRATTIDSTHADYFFTLARVAEQLDSIPTVARAYRRLVVLDEDDGESWFQLAAAEARLARFGAADTALTRAAALNPQRPGLYFLKGWVRESTGHPDEAIALYRKHLAAHPNDQTTRRRLIVLLRGARRYEEAWKESHLVTQVRSDDLDALETEADLALKTGRKPEASALFDRMRRIGHDDPVVVARVLAILARNGRGADAVAMATQWSNARPGDVRGIMLIAQAHALSGAVDPAIDTARRAVEAAPDSLAPRILLGRLCQANSRFKEAGEVWTEALARFPGNDGIMLDLAFCREQLGDIPGAERAAREVLKREPDQATALNFLGYLYAEHNQNLNEAETMVSRALALEPDNGAFMDSMGWVYYRLGRLSEARVQLERAVELTGDPVVHEHLGDVYKDLRLLELARDQYRKSLAGDGSNSRVKTKLAETR